MRIIKPSRIFDFAARHPRAASSLEHWLHLTKAAKWRHLRDVRSTFPAADPARVGSGKTVVIFNIAGNQYRLITAVHFNLGKVFVLRFLTHKEYDQQGWKEQL